VAVVASHAPGEHLEACLRSIERERLAAVVVDDGSPHGCVSAIASRWPLTRVVRLERNRGFAAAANAGIAALDRSPASEHGARWVLFLNDDARLEPGFVAAIRPHLDEASPFSMLGALRLRADDPERIDSAGLELGTDGGARDWLGGEPVSSAPREPVEIFGPSGGAALVRLELLTRVGGFEESYFAYFEDVDLTLRARALGARALLVPDARVLHLGGATARARAYRRLVWLERNRVRTVLRHYPAALAAPCLARAVTGAAERALGGNRARFEADRGAPRASGLTRPLAALAHLEGWLRAALRAPSDRHFQARHRGSDELAGLASWIGAPGSSRGTA
jgi:GT2 family glycosyltransferase